MDGARTFDFDSAATTRDGRVQSRILGLDLTWAGIHALFVRSPMKGSPYENKSIHSY